MIEVLWVVWGEDYLSRAAGAAIQLHATSKTPHRIVYYGDRCQVLDLCLERGLVVEQRALPPSFHNRPGAIDQLRIEEFTNTASPTIYCDADVYWMKPIPFDESLDGPLGFGYSIYGNGPGEEVEKYVLKRWGVDIPIQLNAYEDNTFYAIEGESVSPLWSRVVPNIGVIWMKDGFWVEPYQEIYLDLLGRFPGVFGLGEFALSILQKIGSPFRSVIWPGINRMPMFGTPWHKYLVDARHGRDEVFITESSEIAIHTGVFSCPETTPSVKLDKDGFTKVSYYE